MSPTDIMEILHSTPALFNARFHKDAHTISAYITEHFEVVTDDEVRAATSSYCVNNQTGNISPA